MSLAAGTRLGPYEVISPIGKGGMGEVYRARDTKLDRDIAIKVLPEEFAKDKERCCSHDHCGEHRANIRRGVCKR